MSIAYTIKDSLYLNITNKCPCACTFCIRKNGDNTVGADESMWLSHEPSVDEVLNDIKRFDIKKYNEIVFCGYGEPLCALDTALEVAKKLKEETSLPIRLNTNGLSDLINKKPTAHLLKGLFDCVSVSLNAPNEKRYLEVTNSVFKEGSFNALLSFSKECKKYVKEVVFTVVDVITPEEIKECEKLAKSLEIPLRVREYLEKY